MSAIKHREQGYFLLVLVHGARNVERGQRPLADGPNAHEKAVNVPGRRRLEKRSAVCLILNQSAQKIGGKDGQLDKAGDVLHAKEGEQQEAMNQWETTNPQLRPK